MKPWAQALIAICIAVIIVVPCVLVAIFINAAIEDHAASPNTTTAADTVGANSKSPATDEENLRVVINYLKMHAQLVVWRPSGQREVWTMYGDTIELDFYTGSGPLSDPSYDPGTAYVKLEDQQIKFGSKSHDTEKVEWTAKDDFGFSTVLARAVQEMKKDSG